MTLRENIRRALRAPCNFDVLKVYAPRLSVPDHDTDRKAWARSLRDFILRQPYNLSEAELFNRCVQAGYYSATTSRCDAGSFRTLTKHRFTKHQEAR